MTTTNRMHHFKLLAEQLALGEKLLTTQEKVAIMSRQHRNFDENFLALKQLPVLVLRHRRATVPGTV